MNKTQKTLVAANLLFAFASVCFAADSKPPRKIYGHYMGCFVAGSGAIHWHATSGLETMDAPHSISREEDPLKRNLGAWARSNVGGTYRNFALAPQNRALKIREAAELEIKRAMRIGLDGFTFDAGVGG
jgi:hypothetical protein